MIPLNSSDSIGDSLSSISIDFSSIDFRTYYLNVSSVELFDPLKTFVDNSFNAFTDLVTTVKNNSAKWIDMETTVTTNSSAWIKPILYVHDTIMSDLVPVTTNLFTVSSAFVQKYPVFSPLPETVYPEYVERQKAYVYFYTYAYAHDEGNLLNFVETKNSDLFAYCDCPTSSVVTVYCVDQPPGGSLSCNHGTISCSVCGASCAKSASVPCYYENGTNHVERYISLNVNAYFDDRYEKKLVCAIFQIQNCEWEFLRYL